MRFGRAFFHFSKRLETSMSVTPKLVDAFSQHSSGWRRKEQLGVRDQKPMAIGIVSIDVSGDGAMPVSFKNSMNIPWCWRNLCAPRWFDDYAGSFICGGCSEKNAGQVCGEALGRSHGALRRNSMLQWVRRFTVAFYLKAGACHEVREAPALIAGYACEYVIADTAYDSDALRTQAIILGINGFSL